jgi:hypothetical protein
MGIIRLLPASALIGLLAGCAAASADTSAQAPASAPGAVPPANAAEPPTQSGAGGPAEFGLAGTSATSVGARAAQLAHEVDRLDASAGSCSTTEADIKAQRTQLSTDYFTRVGQINARLQAGTTAGNPELVASWQTARGSLDSLDREAARLGDLVTSCTNDASQATYLSESIKAAMSLRGGVDADRVELVRQSGRVGSISSSLDLTLDLMLDDFNRQNEMLLVEHRNLATLARAIEVGEVLGGNLGLKAAPLPTWSAPGREADAPAPHHRHAAATAKPQRLAPPAAAPAAVDAAPAAATEAAPAESAAPEAAPEAPANLPEASPTHPIAHKPRQHPAAGGTAQPAAYQHHHNKPLIVIPLGGDESYEHALYDVVNGVLSKQPNARFVVEAGVEHNPDRSRAVLAANAAHRQANAVARSIVAFGLPQGRVVTARAVSSSGGIRVYAE